VIKNHKDFKKLEDESNILIAFSDGNGKAKVLKEK
jgi:hypothetical protein